MNSRNQSLDVATRIAAIFLLIYDLWIVRLIVPRTISGNTDFVAYYGAAQQLLERKDIYANAGVLPYIHPAYEVLALFWLGFFSLPTAFWLFSALNIGIVAFVWRTLKLPWEALAFPALWFAFMMGTDSFLLLFCLTSAWYVIRQKDPVVAGFLIGLGMFRFQDLLPLLLLLAFWKEWKVLRGAAVSALPCAGLSMIISSPMRYVQVLLSLIHQNGRYLHSVDNMVNLRGLLYGTAPSLEGLLLPVCTVSVLGFAAWLGRKSVLEERISIALTACCLVSYHFYLHDLVIVLIPIAYMIWERKPFAREIASVLIVTSVLGLLSIGIYLICLAVIAMFVPFVLARSLERVDVYDARREIDRISENADPSHA